MGMANDGRSVVFKRFDSTTTDSGQLEARWLAAANHPGVVHLVSRVDDPPLTVTEHVVGPTLRTAHLEPMQAAPVLAVVAETLADLHQRKMYHGAVNPDHILLAADQPELASAVLCSPVPSEDRSVDSSGLGRCIEWLLADWEARNLRPPSEWHRLARRLAAEPPVDLRRVAHQLRALAPSPSPSRSPRLTKPSTVRIRRLPLTTLAAVVGAAIALVLLSRALATGQEAAPIGARFQTDRGVFAVGQLGDTAVALPQPCPGQPHALLLDHASDTIWVFETIRHGAPGTLMTQVSGATMLEVEAAVPCPRAWAAGPAGRVELDWP